MTLQINQGRYRKRPVVVEAYQFDPAHREPYVRVWDQEPTLEGWKDIRWGLSTTVGWMEVRPGDWIVAEGVWRSVVRPEIFAATYERVTE